VRLRDWTAARRHRQDPEGGQTTVEFALILIPLLILVVGIIQFCIALNYWLDMNRLSNQGARWAVVNGYPGISGTPTKGDPVQVKLTAPYRFFFINSVGITLTARATMRLEQVPKLQSGGVGPTC